MMDKNKSVDNCNNKGKGHIGRIKELKALNRVWVRNI
ncbi:hypothetical protein AAZX31_02G117000 [Glycine max]